MNAGNYYTPQRLAVPFLRFGDGKPATQAQLAGERFAPFVDARPISAYCIVYFKDTAASPAETAMLTAFNQLIWNSGDAYRGVIAARPAIWRTTTPLQTLTAAIDVCRRQTEAATGLAKPTVVFCILPARNYDAIDLLKSWADVHAGINTFYLSLDSVARMLTEPLVRANGMAKLNAQLGGQNFLPETLGYPALDGALDVCGVDALIVGLHYATVSLPLTLKRLQIVAVAGTTTATWGKTRGFLAACAPEGSTLELFANPMAELLHAWVRANPYGRLGNIILYRQDTGRLNDDEICNQELPMLEQLMASFGLNARLTYIAWLPDYTDGEVAAEMVANQCPPPEYAWAWVYGSRATPQRPTTAAQYTCVRHGLMSSQALQEMSHILCHTNQLRGGTPTSVPSPLGNAALMIARAASHIKGAFASESGLAIEARLERACIDEAAIEQLLADVPDDNDMPSTLHTPPPDAETPPETPPPELLNAHSGRPQLPSDNDSAPAAFESIADAEKSLCEFAVAAVHVHADLRYDSMYFV